jgi:hypothetical protein
MPKERLPRHPAARQWLRRLDRFAADLNVLLVMFAIGLAVLDVTLLFSHRLLERVPVTHAVYAGTQAGSSKPAGN